MRSRFCYAEVSCNTLIEYEDAYGNLPSTHCDLLPQSCEQCTSNQAEDIAMSLDYSRQTWRKDVHLRFTFNVPAQRQHLLHSQYYLQTPPTPHSTY
jgi:hypothetical protein